MKNPVTCSRVMAALLMAGLFSGSMDAQGNLRLSSAKVEAVNPYTQLPNFIRPLANLNLNERNFVSWAEYSFNLPQGATLKAYDVQQDELGFTHTRYKQYYNALPVEGSMLITHSKEGKIKSINGDYFQQFGSDVIALQEADALHLALRKVNAQKYMWQNEAFTKQKQIADNDPGFTFFPKGELVMVHRSNSDYTAANMRPAYKFNIYAEQPLYRANVFVDAVTGEILDEQNLICTIDVVGTAVTKYSGTVTMTSDSFAVAQYRLRETGRGQGINTYNLQNGTTYNNTDFTNNSSAWNLAPPDQAAADAHWGAEMTYDYYKLTHNRNSIDNNGFPLNSYVHYSNNYQNAFWNGVEMTYGDGGGIFTIMTGLDVCGHEITHGLTSKTAQLGGGEAGALNEGFSDIFGTTIETFARPGQHDWIMGAEITTNNAGIRDMSNPKSLGQPDCYLGTNWDPGLEPHQDNGPCIYWYYLLCQGGSGTNDLGNAWTVNGITMNKARMIAFRGLTVYFTPTTTYNDARRYTIQAASDLYGACSTELQETTNAWYAVGVGAAFSPSGVVPGFSNTGVTCAVPMTVSFTNSTTSGASYVWYFGDGSTSTSISPTHTYTAAGTDTVKLVATSCSGAKDSVMKVLTIGAQAITGPLSEGFETATLPNSDWGLSSTGANWAVNSFAAATGTKSIMIDNFSNPSGSTTELDSRSYDISGYATPKLTFKMAYQQKASSNNDKLQVLSSIDCGATWLIRWTKFGSALATVTPPSASPFIPAPTQFATYTVNINGVAGQPNVRFRFKFSADTASAGPGNNIYLDDINLFDASVGIATLDNESTMELYPVPSKENVHLTFNLSEEKTIAVNVTDLLGRTVEVIPAKNYPAGTSSLLLAEKVKYGPGIYLVNLAIDGKTISRKMIIE